MRHYLFLTYLVIIMLLTGCWDEMPIEERGFVIGSALDISEEGQGDTSQIMLTNQFVISAALPSGGQGGGEGQQAFNNLSASGYSTFHISREMLSLTDWIPNYEHLKIIVVSKEVASEKALFSSVLDTFIRDHEMRRGIKIMIADGSAKEVLNIKPKTEELPAIFIDTIMDNNIKSLNLVEPVQMGTLHRYMLNKNSYVIPLLSMYGDGLRYDGVAVFAGEHDHMIGTLSGDDIKGLKLIQGNITNGAILFEIKGEKMVFEISNTRSKININTDDPENIKISIKVDTEGAIAEMFGSRSLVDRSYMDEIEQRINKRIEQLILGTVEAAQQELEVDFLGFRNILRQKHYDTWKEIEGNWERGDQLFLQSTVDVSVNSMVRNIGASDKVKKDKKE